MPHALKTFHICNFLSIIPSCIHDSIKTPVPTINNGKLPCSANNYKKKL